MDKLIQGLRMVGQGAQVERVRRDCGPMVLEGMLSKGYAEQDDDELTLTEAGRRALADLG